MLAERARIFQQIPVDEYAAADGDITFIRENNGELVTMYTDMLEKIKENL